MEAGNVLISSIVVLCVPLLRNLFFLKQKDIARRGRDGSRIEVFDFVRGVSILAVIAIHVIFVMLENNLFSSLFLPNFLNALLRFAVPVFFITSGCLLYLKEYSFASLFEFYSVKVLRVFVPYFLIVMGVVLWRGEGIQAFLMHSVSGDISLPFYFVVVLAQFYFVYPALKYISQKSWFLPITFIISLFCFLYPPLWYIGRVPFAGQFLFFLAYGMTKGNTDNAKPQARDHLIWFLLIGVYILLFILLPTYYYNTQLIYGVAVFQVLLAIFPRISFGVREPVVSMGKLSLWIFLIHFPITVYMIRLVHVSINNPLLLLIVSFVLTCFLSIGVAVVFQKIYSLCFPLFRTKRH